MTKRLLLCFVLFGSVRAFSQTSAYQDANSNTSIYLENSKASLVYNVSDAKFTVGYLTMPITAMVTHLTDKIAADEKSGKKTQQELDVEKAELKALVEKANGAVSENRWRRSEVGAHFSGKPSTDLTGQILQSSSSPASVSGGAYYGVHNLISKTPAEQSDDVKKHHITDDWLTVNVDYTRSTFDTIATSSSTPVAQHFNGFSIMPAWDQLWNFVPGFTLLSGESAGIARSNNSGNLSKVEVDTTQVTSGLVSVVKQQDAYLGTYTTTVGVPVYSDFVFIPHGASWLSIDAFERANVTPSARYAEGGVGVYIAKPDKPSDVLGGISAGWKDGKRVVAVVAGWSF